MPGGYIFTLRHKHNNDSDIYKLIFLFFTYLSPYVIYKTVHTWFHTETVLTWQQLWVSEPVQADAARQQRLKLLHLHFALGLCICNK